MGVSLPDNFNPYVAARALGDFEGRYKTVQESPAWLQRLQQEGYSGLASGADITREMLAESEYNKNSPWGRDREAGYNEALKNASNYEKQLGALYNTDLDAATKSDLKKQAFQQQYGGMGEATKRDFDTLLGRLEGSKIRQEEAKNVSARPGIYAAGLANMMKNF